MTTPNDLSTGTNCSSQITLIASANVPPQGPTTPRFNRDQMQIGEREYSKKDIINQLAFECKWGECVVQMKQYQSICKKNSRVTTPPSHDTVAIVLRALTRSVGVICLSQYLQHLIWTVK
jgi:hypothetical protein